MSNYIKATDFQAKDGLITGDPLKTIKGREINDEFNAIQTAIATKADISSPNLLGNPTAPTQVFGNSSTRLATTAFVQTALGAIYPIGTIYTSVVSTNPNTLFGFGTWVAFGAGKTLIGLDAGDALFDTVEVTGGSKNAVVVSHTHTATVTDPGHTHVVNGADSATEGAGVDFASPTYTRTGVLNSATTGITVANSTEGVSGTNANLPPYITVYMWKRTA